MSDIFFQKLNSLLKTSTILNSNLSIEQLLPLIMLTCKDLAESSACSLFLLDEEKKFLYCEAAVGEGGEIIREYLRMDLDEGIAGWVAREKKPVLMQDAYQDERFSSRWDEISGFETKSLICVPIFTGGDIIGTLQVFNKQNGQTFDKSDLQFLTTLADIAAIAINNSRLHESLKKRVLELSLLHEFEREIAVNFDLKNLSHWLLDKCLEVMESRIGSILIWDKEDSVLRVFASRGLSRAVSDSLQIHLGEGISGLVARDKMPLLVQNIEQDPQLKTINRQKYETKSLISAPIILHNDLLGVLNVNNKISGFAFNRNDLNMLVTLANRLALVIKNIQLTHTVSKTEEEQARGRLLMDQIIPDFVPEYPEIEIDLKYILVDTVGGDFYKFFKIDETRLGILQADVCGHGLSAALLAMTAHAVITTFEKDILKSPGRFFLQLNRTLTGILGGNFLTAFYCIIDTKNNKLIHANAGHRDPFLYMSERNEFLRLKSRGTLIGVFADTLYEEREIDFIPGDRLFIYTDGILEIQDSQTESGFEEDYLLRLLEAKKNLDGKHLVEELASDVRVRAGRQNFDDDVTLIAVERKCQQAAGI